MTIWLSLRGLPEPTARVGQGAKATKQSHLIFIVFCLQKGMIKIPMNPWVLKKLFFALALLFTFHFLLFTSSSFAGYPSLMENDLIDEVDSGDNQGKTNHDDKISGNKNSYDKLGFYCSVAFRFSELFFYDRSPDSLHQNYGGSMHKPGFTYKFISLCT